MPIPEFIRQIREAGLTSRVVGTTYGMDIPTYQTLGAQGEKWTGLMPYRYAYDPESRMGRIMREH